jgi:hypothetical protein
MFRSIRLMLATIAVAAMLAACTGAAAPPGVASLDDATASGAPAPSASAMTPQDAALAYARCMRENGVDMPDPVVETTGDGGISIGQSGPDGPPVNKDDFREAEETCRHFMEAVRPDAGPPLTAEEMDQMLAFAQCMREHGIPMDDPTIDGGTRVQIGSGPAEGGTTGGPPPVNETELQAAHEACSSLLPGRMRDKMSKPGSNSVGAEPAGGKPNIAPAPAGTN